MSMFPLPRRFRLAWAGVVAFVAAAGLMSACDGPTDPTQSATLRLMLRDAAVQDIGQVNVFITTATVKPVGEEVRQLDLELVPNPVDLLTLQTQPVVLAEGAIPPGQYEFIRLNLDPAQCSVLDDGELKALEVPSSEIKINHGFTVPENSEVTITLDFDADESLVALGNGGWLLKPVVIVTGQVIDDGA